MPGVALVSFDEIIADFGPKVGLRILKKYGGRRITKPTMYLLEIRNRSLYADSRKGMSDYELSARYRINLHNVRKIKQRMRKKAMLASTSLGSS